LKKLKYLVLPRSSPFIIGRVKAPGKKKVLPILQVAGQEERDWGGVQLRRRENLYGGSRRGLSVEIYLDNPAYSKNRSQKRGTETGETRLQTGAQP